MGQRSVRFPDGLVERAEAWARANDRSFSYVVVKGLEEFLARQSDPGMVEVQHRQPRRSQPAPVETVIRPGSPHSVPVPGVRLGKGLVPPRPKS